MFCLVKQASTALYVFVPDSESVHAAGRSELREAEDWIRATGAACEEIRQLAPLADAHISLVYLHQYDPVHSPFPQTQVMWPDSNSGFNTHHAHGRTGPDRICVFDYTNPTEGLEVTQKDLVPFVTANMATVPASTLIPVLYLLHSPV